MNRAQQIAYQSPCFLAEETLQAKFHWGFRLGGLALTAHLTANIGLE